MEQHELVIVGGGPAGLTAALYTAREQIETLVIERAAFGGQAAGTAKIDNLPGFPNGIAGIDFARRLRRQAERFGVELLEAQEVKRLDRRRQDKTVTTADGQAYTAAAVLIATGSRYKRLGVPGESEYLGAGVHFCATCDGPFYRGKAVAVIGGGNSAAGESLQLAKFAEHVTILVRGDRFKATRIIEDSVFSHPKISVRWHTEVKAFVGEQSKLTGVELRDNQTGLKSRMPLSGVFVFIGLAPNSSFLNASDIRLTPWGFVVTGHDLIHGAQRPLGYERRDPFILETSIPGVFAAGDVRDKSTKQVASAAGEGASAALMVREYLKTR